MKRVFAFVGGPRAGQSTLAAELAFEWVKRGASACVLTAGSRIEPLGFDSFTLAGLAPPSAGGQRDLAALAADLAQLEDYDYLILDLPQGSADLAVAAGISGAELVVTLNIEQGALNEVSGMFREIARRPPQGPLKLVLNKVRDSAAASDAAERLMVSIARQVKLTVRLAASLPWDPDLAALEEAPALVSTTLPAGALAKAVPSLADALNGEAGRDAAAPVAMVFWEQLQTLLQQFQKEDGTRPALSDHVNGAAAAWPAEPSGSPPTIQAPAAAAPELTAELARIAAGLEQLTEEVRRLHRGLVRKFEQADDAEDRGHGEGAGEPIRLDFESYRRSKRDGGN